MLFKALCKSDFAMGWFWAQIFHYHCVVPLSAAEMPDYEVDHIEKIYCKTDRVIVSEKTNSSGTYVRFLQRMPLSTESWYTYFKSVF